LARSDRMAAALGAPDRGVAVETDAGGGEEVAVAPA
jgi:hypothetical protein